MAEFCTFDVLPLAQSKPIKNPGIHNLNYTSQDYWSLKDRMIELIKQNFEKDFNDFNESSVAMMMVELWAFLADTLHFKIDQLANEVFIDTVTELQNAYRLAMLVGFRPTPPLPAKAMFIATIMNPLSTDTFVPTPFAVGIDQGRTMELFPADISGNPIYDQQIVIAGGQVSNNKIVGVEGMTIHHTLEGTGGAGQVHRLANSPVLWKSIQLSIDGVWWQEVEFFTDSQPKREFRVEYDENFKAYLIFGNGKAGLIPPKGSAISVSYRVGGGTAGNIITGAIEQSSNIMVPGVNHMVVVTVKNYTRGEGGYNGDTIEDIRRKLPTYLRTQDRAVTGLDYKSLADNFATGTNGLIGKSTAVLRNHGCAGNIIDIYVLGRDSNDGLVFASDGLKKELKDEIDKKKVFTDYVVIRDGHILMVDVQIDVIMDRSNRRFEDSIMDRINRRLNWFFSIHNWEYGQTLRATDIIKALADIKEVDRFEVSLTTTRTIENGQGHTDIVTTNYNEIVRLDGSAVNFSYKTAGER